MNAYRLAALLAFLAIASSIRAEEPTGDLAKKLAGVKFEQYAASPGYSEGPTWRKGEVFFCSGALLRVDEKKVVHKYLELGPAGTVLRADGHLLVADNKYRAILDVAPEGKVSVLADRAENQPLRSLNDLGGSGGDGCAFDAAGNLWVADFHRPETGKGRITIISPEGKVLAYLPVPAKVVSNIAFGGPNHDEIFCTTGDPPGVQTPSQAEPRRHQDHACGKAEVGGTVTEDEDRVVVSRRTAICKQFPRAVP